MTHLNFGTLLFVILLTSLSQAYINIEQYCKAFDENFKPVICIMKANNNNNTGNPYPQETVHSFPIAEKLAFLDKIKHKPKYRPHPPRPRPHPPPPIFIHHQKQPDYYGWEKESEEDVDCSCDLNCYPMISNMPPNITGVSYRCRSCGSSCWVRSLIQSNCSCAIPSGNASCSCTATCAAFRSDLSPRMSGGWGWGEPDYEEHESDSTEDLNCIFNINNLTDTRVGEEQRPYNCQCCKSTEAQRTSDPDFVCICQRVSVTERRGLEILHLPSD